jgi:hypothetical protein
LYCVGANLEDGAVAICDAKPKTGPCQAEAMANGKCRRHGGKSTGPTSQAGKQRVAQAARESANRRHAELRASGQPARFYELTPEHRQAQRDARAGKPMSEDTKAAISAGMVSAHGARRKREYDAQIEAHRALLESVGPSNCQFNEMPRVRSAVHGNLFNKRKRRHDA